jgi:Flp pilus assembly protein TadD
MGEAIACYRQAVRAESGDAKAYNNLGTALLSAQPQDEAALDEAIGCFRAAARIEPKNPRFHMNLGEAWKRRGRYDEAIAEFDEALGLDRNFPNLKLARAQAVLLKAERDARTAPPPREVRRP